MRRTILTTSILSASALLLSPATAQVGQPEAGPGEVGGTVSIGIGARPEFEGSDEQALMPFVHARLSKNGRSILRDGLGLRADILSSERLEFGPASSLTLRRDDDADDARIAALREIDDSLAVGGYGALHWRDIGKQGAVSRLGVQVLRDLSGVHDGLIVQPYAEYSAPFGDRWTAGVQVMATTVSEDYADTYFSIDDDNAVRSGLEQFDADGGMKEAGLAFVYTYQLTDRWSITGFQQYRRLLGDAADSPIVDEAGSADQFNVALAIGRRF